MEIKLSNIQIDINDDITSNKKHIKKKSIVILFSHETEAEKHADFIFQL